MGETELSRLVVRLTGDGESYLKMLKHAQEETHKTNRVVHELNEGLKEFGKDVASRLMGGLGFASMIGVGAAGAVKGGEFMLEQFEKQEKASIQMKAVLEANGREVSSTTEEYKRFAEQMRDTTTLGYLQTQMLLSQAEAFGQTGKAAEQMVQNAGALSAITGRSAESMMRMTTAIQEGDMHKAMGMARLIPQLRGVKDEEEFIAKYSKLVDAGNLAMAESAQTVSHRYAVLKDRIGEAAGELGGIVMLATEKAIDSAPGAGILGHLFERSQEAVRAMKDVGDAIDEVKAKLRKSPGEEGDYDEAIKELQARKEAADAELKGRSIWRVSTGEVLGRTAAHEIEKEIKILEELKGKLATKKEPVDREKNLDTAYTQLLEKTRKTAQHAGRHAEEVERAKLAAQGLSQARQDELVRLENIGKLHKQIRELEDKARFHGLKPEEKAQEEAANAGASAEQLDRMRRKYEDMDLTDKLKKVKEDLMSPQEKLDKEMEQLDKLFARGALFADEYAKAVQHARDKILGLMAAHQAANAAWGSADRARQFLDYRREYRPGRPEDERPAKEPGPIFPGGKDGGAAEIVKAVETLGHDIKTGAIRFVTVDAGV